MISLSLFLLALAAGGRITRFITDDVLFEPVRAFVDRRFGPDGKLAYLLGCAWCSGIYVFAVVFALMYVLVEREVAPAAFIYPAAALAASWVYALLYSHFDPAAQD